jgi:hypothetical protein
MRFQPSRARGLPANTTLTSGFGSFAGTLKTVGNRTITVTDTANSNLGGTSNIITVTGPVASHFTISAPSSVPKSLVAWINPAQCRFNPNSP